jgi:hypothetical protein
MNIYGGIKSELRQVMPLAGFNSPLMRDYIDFDDKRHKESTL